MRTCSEGSAEADPTASHVLPIDGFSERAIAPAESVTHFVPPFPPRPKTDLSLLALLRHSRSDLLKIWPDKAFEWQFFGTRLLFKHIFVANSPDTVQAVFVDRAANYERKSPQQRHALAPLLGDGLFISDGATWRERRRIIAQITHVSRLDALAPVMSEVAAERRDQWERLAPGTRVDALSEMAQMTAEIICRSVFGRSMKPGAARIVVDAFSAYQAAVGQMDLPSLLSLPDLLPRAYNVRVRRSAARLKAVVDELIDEALAQGESSGPSLVRSMAEQVLSATGSTLTREAFRNEASTLFMAGHETTANTLAWAWYLLSQAPWAERAVQAEADALRGRPATYADLPRLPYTKAVIQETLRLYPPVPLQARQAARADHIRNRHIPAGALVILVPWLLHRHRGLWERPDAFEPERWLPGGSGAPSRYAYVPFSIGPRICTGAAFGTAEAVICLATLAGSARLTLAPDHAVEPVCRLTLRPGNSLPMDLVPRGVRNQ